MLKWLTHNGGNKYHNLIHCMQDDWVWIWITGIYCAVIFVGYLLIANQARMELNNSGMDKIKIKALRSFIAVFLFCGLVGYLYVILQIWIPAYKARAIFGIVLTFWTWKLYFQIKKGGLFRSLTVELKEKTESLKVSIDKNKHMTSKLVEVQDALVAKIKEIELLTSNLKLNG